MPWQIASDQPLPGPWEGKDVVGWLWEIRRDATEQSEHVRWILVEVTGTAMASANEFLPDETASAKETLGRSAVESILEDDDPPRRITLGTTGRTDGLEGVRAAVTNVTIRPATETDTAMPLRYVPEPGVIPDRETPTDLLGRVGGFGCALEFTDEPDGGFWWHLFATDGTLLQHGYAKDWDDARLDVLMNFYPPSEEGREG